MPCAVSTVVRASYGAEAWNPKSSPVILQNAFRGFNDCQRHVKA
jgi:hypothetical protein